MELNDDTQAIWDVIRVALILMMCVQIFGVYFNAAFPSRELKPVYEECDFKLKDHTITLPCEIRSVRYE